MTLLTANQFGPMDKLWQCNAPLNSTAEFQSKAIFSWLNSFELTLSVGSTVIFINFINDELTALLFWISLWLLRKKQNNVRVVKYLFIYTR